MRRILRQADKRTPRKLRIDAPQLQSLEGKVILQLPQICYRRTRIHAGEYLPLADNIAFPDEELAHNARIGRLHDLKIAQRHHAPLCNGDDVQARDERPGHSGKQKQQ